jgi:hypothetical protein
MKHATSARLLTNAAAIFYRNFCSLYEYLIHY